MKNLSEKFDQFHRDFDREAIWQRIDRPSRKPIFHSVLWVLAILGTFISLIYITHLLGKVEDLNVDINDPILENSRDKEINYSSNEIFEDIDINDSVSVSLQNTKEDHSKSVSLKSFQSNVYHIHSKKNDTTAQAGHQLFQEEEFTPISISAIDNSTSMVLDVEKNQVMDPLDDIPTFVGPLFYNRELELNMSVSNILPLKQKGWHSIAIRAGIGSHSSIFSSLDESAEKWRSDFEKSDLDYSLGLRYEYMFNEGWHLSASVGYQLFKDKINTSFIREHEEEKTLIEYRLYNHYHLVTAQLEVGKRFHDKGFFWDISSGIHFPIIMVTQADYFISRDKLADNTKVVNEYNGSGNLFLSGQVGIGKYFGSRLFTRTGVQVYSPLNMNSSQASIQHRILPVGFFLEVGMQF